MSEHPTEVTNDAPSEKPEILVVDDSKVIRLAAKKNVGK
jgi:CheY-like chemotaxis protein